MATCRCGESRSAPRAVRFAHILRRRVRFRHDRGGGHVLSLFSIRCASSDRKRCPTVARSTERQAVSARTGTVHKHFCIDTYEWPNKALETPVVMKNWYEARDACQSVGKRLCSQDRRTLACEGPDHLPYPYGYARDASACNIDKAAIQVDESALEAARPPRRRGRASLARRSERLARPMREPIRRPRHDRQRRRMDGQRDGQSPPERLEGWLLELEFAVAVAP